MTLIYDQQVLELAEEELNDIAKANQEKELLPIIGLAEISDPVLEERKARITSDLYGRAGTRDNFLAILGKIIRDSIDYVIDSPTLFRYGIDELEPDEKTAIGKRIERMLRFVFMIPKGKKLDVWLGGEDVDIKTTMGKNWMFSRSSHDRLNLLIAYNEKSAVYRIGLVYVLPEQLGAANRDQKQSLTAAHRESISWLALEYPYPPNFLKFLPEETFKKITMYSHGMRRVLALLRLVQNVAIPRHAICSVANQKDPMRRIRSNGGARDLLWKEGILVLSGNYDVDKDIAFHTKGVTLNDEETMTILRASIKTLPRLEENYMKWHKLF